MGTGDTPYSRSDWEQMDAPTLREHVVDTWTSLKQKFDRIADLPEPISESIKSFDTQFDVLMNDKLSESTVEQLERSSQTTRS